MTDSPSSFSIRHWPKGERPREKLIQFGPQSLTDAELLAILLRVGKEGSSAIDIGRQLIDHLNGISGQQLNKMQYLYMALSFVKSTSQLHDTARTVSYQYVGS